MKNEREPQKAVLVLPAESVAVTVYSMFAGDTT
jgi:hypothetical protein